MKQLTHFACAALVCLAIALPANAALTLTQAGIDDGFVLSTFVGGYFGQYGPLAQGIDSDGNVITGSYFDQTIYVFKDVDGQKLSDAISKVGYNCQTGNCQFAMTTAGGQVYGAQLLGGIYEHFNNDGTFSPIPNLQADGLFSYAGMWTDPANGHIISASQKGLVEIDPVNGTYRLIVGGIQPDGVSISPDGMVAYVAINNGISAYRISDGVLLQSYATGHGADGTGVITGGMFDGFVVINNNDGTVGLLDPQTAKYVTIASGGTRGDFTSLDPTNGSLFLSQYDQVARLQCRDNGNCFGAVPEPSGIALLGTVIVGLVGPIRRRFGL